MIIKRIIGGVLTILLIAILAGCGMKADALQSSQTTSPPVQSSAQQSTTQQSPSSIKQQQSQIQSIDTKSAPGQAQIDQRIDQQLQSLDNAVDSLDKSAGNL